MSTKAPFKTVSFLDIPIYQINMKETLLWIEQCIQDRRPRFLCTINAALFAWSHKDPFLKQTYQEADLATADSMVVCYALKLLGLTIPEPLEACQIMFEFIKHNCQKGYRFYLLGAKPEILRRAVVALRKEYPGIQIVGSHHGFFKPEEEYQIVQDITDVKPDCLFVGISSPQKESFLKRNMAKMNVPICLGVGGGIDILAGEFRLAPLWLRKLGLAWFYRLLLEPRRMWKRYLTTNTIFLILFAKVWIKKMVFRKPPNTTNCKLSSSS